MTREEGQALYEQHGRSCRELGKFWGVSRDCARERLKKLGCTLRPRGGVTGRTWKISDEQEERRLLRAGLPVTRRKLCDFTGKLCVMHDDPEACILCKSPALVGAPKSHMSLVMAPNWEE